MYKTKIKSIFTPEFLKGLEMMKVVDIKIEVIKLISEHNIKEIDKTRIRATLNNKNDLFSLVKYVWDLNLKYEGYGVL